MGKIRIKVPGMFKIAHFIKYLWNLWRSNYLEEISSDDIND